MWSAFIAKMPPEYLFILSIILLISITFIVIFALLTKTSIDALGVKINSYKGGENEKNT